MNDNRSNLPGSPGSLLEGLDAPAAVAAARRPHVIPWTVARTRAWFAAAWRHKRTRQQLIAAGAMLAIAALAATWTALRPMSRPDYDRGSLDRVFEYTLLTDGFNNLPIDERIEMIGQLMGRVRSMESSDSVLMAAFATKIQGSARDQLVENASRLMVDLMDRAAIAYDLSASPEERTNFVLQEAVRLQLAMEQMAGESRDIPVEDRVTEMREQAGRDMEAIDSGEMGPEEAGQAAMFLGGTMGAHSTTAQKARTGVFMRDMGRVLRGQDIATGRPLPKPPGGG